MSWFQILGSEAFASVIASELMMTASWPLVLDSCGRMPRFTALSAVRKVSHATLSMTPFGVAAGSAERYAGVRRAPLAPGQRLS